VALAILLAAVVATAASPPTGRRGATKGSTTPTRGRRYCDWASPRSRATVVDRCSTFRGGAALFSPRVLVDDSCYADQERSEEQREQSLERQRHRPRPRTERRRRQRGFWNGGIRTDHRDVGTTYLERAAGEEFEFEEDFVDYGDGEESVPERAERIGRGGSCGNGGGIATSTRDDDDDDGRATAAPSDRRRERIHREHLPSATAQPPSLLWFRGTAGASSSSATRGGGGSNRNGSTRNGGGSSVWPPWPFNLLQRRRQRGYYGDDQDDYGDGRNSDDSTSSQTNYRSTSSTTTGAQLAWSFLRHSSKAGLRNFQYLSSQLLFHLPPAAHPLMLLALIPQRHKVMLPAALQDAAAEETKRRGMGMLEKAMSSSSPGQDYVYESVVPMFSNPFVRNVMLTSVGLALFSWAHYQLHRKRPMTLLPLRSEYLDINRVILPPFLPEEEAHEQYILDTDEVEEDDDEAPSAAVVENLPLRIQRHLNYAATKTSPWTWKRSWRVYRRSREAQKRDRFNARRMAIVDELMALQTLKKNEQRRRHRLRLRQKLRRKGSRQKQDGNSAGDIHDSDDATMPSSATMPLGYAVVTGASRGIGRALAVELARWEIPLVLVARDVERLTQLAYDLQTCYGVDCAVLQADLCQPGAAEQVHKTIRNAGLPVDILVK